MEETVKVKIVEIKRADDPMVCGAVARSMDIATPNWQILIRMTDMSTFHCLADCLKLLVEGEKLTCLWAW